jgi:hypothetical protein
MCGNRRNDLPMQACALLGLYMRGNLITHVFGPKFVEMIGNVFLRLRLIWLGLEKVAHLIRHFDECFGLHDFDLVLCF